MIDMVLARLGTFAGSLSGSRRTAAAIVVLILLAVAIAVASGLAASGHMPPLAGGGIAWAGS